MSLAIRLARGGMKKKPYYRIVVTDSRNARDGKFLEKIGTYNPLLNKENPDRVKLDGERASHWLSVGAQPSDRVARFLDAAGLRTRAAQSNPTKGIPGAKAKERADAATARQAELDEAAAVAAAAPPAPEPAPVVEAAVPEAAVEAPEAPAVDLDVAAEAPAAEGPSEPEPVEAPADTGTPAAAEAPAAGTPVNTPPADVATPDVDAMTETDATPVGLAI